MGSDLPEDTFPAESSGRLAPYPQAIPHILDSPPPVPPAGRGRLIPHSGLLRGPL